MKAYKLCDSISQGKKLSADGECNNNVIINGKSSGQITSTLNGKSSADKILTGNSMFKQQCADSLSNVPSTAILGANADSMASKSDTNKRHNIETFLSSTVPPNVAENTQNGFAAAAAAAAAAAQHYTSPFSIFTPYLKDMFLAAQLIRGKNE